MKKKIDHTKIHTWKKFLFSLFFVFALLFPVFSFAWVYPVNQVSLPGCRYMHRINHDEDCKMPLPRILSGDYLSYITNPAYRSVYSVLRGATYVGRRDQGRGSHLGVDIVSAQGTPIFAIWSGEVVALWWKNGRGQYIVIEHKINDRSIFSTYAHLESIRIEKGKIVAEGEEIATMWDTGNATASHLHLQIDLTTWSAQDHPYYYWSCQKAVGVDTFSIVDWWLCRDDVLRYTTDPIQLLESQGAILHTISINWQQFYNLIEAAKAISEEDILQYEINAFLTLNDLTVDIDVPENKVVPGQIVSLRIQPKKNIGTGKILLPGYMVLESSDTTVLSVFPNRLQYIGQEREVLLFAQKEWTVVIRGKILSWLVFEQRIDVSTSFTHATVGGVKVTCIPTKKKSFRSLCIGNILDTQRKNISDEMWAWRIRVYAASGTSVAIPTSKRNFVAWWLEKTVPSFSIDSIELTRKNLFRNGHFFFFVQGKGEVMIDVV